MDKFDTKILALLQADGRMTWSELARRVNLSASACQRRVEALLESGVIRHFTVALDEARLGNQVKAFVAVNVDRQNTELAKEFQRKLREHPNVQACHMISGSIDFMLEVVAPDLASFGTFVDGELLGMPAVRDASSSIVLKEVKARRTAIGIQ